MCPTLTVVLKQWIENPISVFQRTPDLDSELGFTIEHFVRAKFRDQKDDNRIVVWMLAEGKDRFEVVGNSEHVTWFLEDLLPLYVREV